MAYADNFTGVDGTEISAHNALFSTSANLKINNNALEAYGVGWSRHGGSYTTDQYVEAKCLTPSIRVGVFVSGDGSTPGNCYYAVFKSDNCLIYKYIAYSQTLLQNVAGFSCTSGDTIRLIKEGNNLILTKNGVAIWTGIGVANQLTGGRPGITMQETGGRLNGWAAGDVVAPSPPTIEITDVYADGADIVVEYEYTSEAGGAGVVAVFERDGGEIDPVSDSATGTLRLSNPGAGVYELIELEITDSAGSDNDGPWGSTIEILDLGGGGEGGQEGPVAPTITTLSLPGATVGEAYSETLTATGTTPITWSIISGALPPGLSLNGSTGAITGTPSSTGTASFTVRAANNEGHDDKALDITAVAGEPVVTGVALPPTLTVYAGRSRNILAVVTGTNVTQAVTWSIQSGGGSINSSGANPVRFTAPEETGEVVLRATSVDNDEFYGETTITIAEAPPATGDSDGLIRSPIRGVVRGSIS